MGDGLTDLDRRSRHKPVAVVDDSGKKIGEFDASGIRTNTELDLDAIEARAKGIPATSGAPIGALYTMYVHAHADLADDCLALIARVSELEATLAKQNEIIAKLFEGKLVLGARISELEAALAGEVAENEALRGD